MYKKMKKISYCLGIVATFAIPATTIISCGENNESAKQEEDQKKLNAITEGQIKTSLSLAAGGDTEYASNVTTILGKANVKINGIDNVQINVNEDLIGNDHTGIVSFSVTVRKSGLKSKVIPIEIIGYNNDQKKLNSITDKQVQSAYGWQSDNTKFPSIWLKKAKQDKLTMTLNELDVTLEVESTDANEANGIATLNVAIASSNLVSKIVTVEIDGFAPHPITQEEIKFYQIDYTKVLKAMDNYAGDSNGWAADNEPLALYENKTIDNFTEIKIEIDKISVDNNNGSVSFQILLTDGSFLAGNDILKTFLVVVSGFMVEINKSNWSQLASFNNGILTINQSVTKIASGAYGTSIFEDGTFPPGGKAVHVLKFEANSKLTTIGTYAFSQNSEIKVINFPNSLITIGEHAFAFSQHIDTITFGNNLKEILSLAFEYLRNIGSLIFPASLTRLNNGAFWNCNINYLKFEGEIPAPGGRVITFIGINKVFPQTNISAIQESSGGTAQQWQDWAITTGQFK